MTILDRCVLLASCVPPVDAAAGATATLTAFAGRNDDVSDT